MDLKPCFFPSLLKLVFFPRLRLRIRIGVRLPLQVGFRLGTVPRSLEEPAVPLKV
jgi:hypothetical protein